jgi:hypothetical protein
MLFIQCLKKKWCTKAVAHNPFQTTQNKKKYIHNTESRMNSAAIDLQQQKLWHDSLISKTVASFQ